ncbi:MAG: protein translocase subunit SecF [Candidatus Levyibacteriota bacterium]
MTEIEMNIIKHKNIFFLISGIVIVPGLISVFLFGLKPAIDFTGGSVGEFQISPQKYSGQANLPSVNQIKNIVQNKNVQVHSIQQTGSTFLIRTNSLDQKQHDQLVLTLKKSFQNVKENSFQTVGATIGGETEANALKAVLIASVAITLYIAFTFRKVSHPVASWKFGVAAIVALLHDVLVVLGIFSILGVLFQVEVDALFITALLTVMGFSVHDTIVVFDRIRENLRKNPRLPFEETVNNSMMETMNRSLNTSLTVVLVLFMLLLYGGGSTKWFIIALLIGIISGTYSSIFNASPLLVLWYQIDKKRRKSA